MKKLNPIRLVIFFLFLSYISSVYAQQNMVLQIFNSRVGSSEIVDNVFGHDFSPEPRQFFKFALCMKGANELFGVKNISCSAQDTSFDVNIICSTSIKATDAEHARSLRTEIINMMPRSTGEIHALVDEVHDLYGVTNRRRGLDREINDFSLYFSTENEMLEDPCFKKYLLNYYQKQTKLEESRMFFQLRIAKFPYLYGEKIIIPSI